MKTESKFMRTDDQSIMTKFARALSPALVAASFAGCTGSVPGSFHLEQQEEGFDVQIQVNTKIDLLWVVDNSASMDVSQEKLRNGFSAFAQKYMQPTWDIRVAVITTDTYLANPAFSNYLNATIPGTTGYASSYIGSRLGSWVNPSWNPGLVNTTTGKFDGGLKYGELVPAWRQNYSRLLSGIHDGPIAGLCWEGLSYFLLGASRCNIRDDQAAYNGPSHCLNPSGSETSITQCVNTVQNDTIHSGKAIIETMPPAGVAGDSAWISNLVNTFIINVTTGSVGSGSERGLSSVAQLLEDNESTSTSFFRQGSLRAIIFVSDEEDQSMQLPSSPSASFNPFTDYACDQAGLVAANGTSPILGDAGNSRAGYCCSEGNCNYGTYGSFGINGISCPSKTVDGYTYTTGICALQNKLIPVASFKNEFDSFFKGLDGDSEGNPNYFVVSIVPLTGQAIQTLAAHRVQDDSAAGAIKVSAVDRGDRYIDFGNLVGNGSLAMNIADEDYTPILDAIGRTIIEKQGTFVLKRAPTGTGKLVLRIRHANGTDTIVPSDKFSLVDNVLTITDLNTILTFASTDKIVIKYEPSTVF